MLRTILRVIRDIDGFFTKLCAIPFSSSYQLIGKCKKRGVCCENIAVFLSDGFWRYPRLKKAAIWWYEFVYNFEKYAEDPALKIVRFRCHYLRNGLCSIHWKRPLICRRYPQSFRHFDLPTVLPGCGYSFVPKRK